MANGKPVRCTLVVVDALVSVNGYEGRHDLIVMSGVDTLDVILGRGFLRDC